MNARKVQVFVCSSLAVAVVEWTAVTLSHALPKEGSEQSGSMNQKAGQLFSDPVLVKNSPTNLRAFDVRWNDNARQRYYLADRTNNAIDLVDSATDTFLGFIGKGHYTGSRPCPNNPKDLRLCAGPNGVVTDDLGHVWSGDGDANIIEAEDKPGTTILRSITTNGKGRIDELAYDPLDRMLMAENDGDTPPYVVFLSVTTGAILHDYILDTTSPFC